MTIKYTVKWKKTNFSDIIDVRSPAEFKEDHISGSINLPVLNNEQRVDIGTIYKKESPFKAKKIGASLVSNNISKHLKKVLISKPGNWKPLIYCWRGGQRSKAFATVLSEIGWQVTILKGGYKTYRSAINNEINKLTKTSRFIVLKGPTGCAKTKILELLKKQGLSVLNLEELASHKGSLLGEIPNKKQPSQKLFESKIFASLNDLKNKKKVFIESESSKIGNLFLPQIVLNKIKTSQAIEINANLDQRIKFLLNDYSKYIREENSFLELFKHAKNKVSLKTINNWLKLYKNKNWYKLAHYLIVDYYDPLYTHNLNKKNNKIISKYVLSSLTNKSLKKFCIELESKLK